LLARILTTARNLIEQLTGTLAGLGSRSGGCGERPIDR